MNILDDWALQRLAEYKSQENLRTLQNFTTENKNKVTINFSSNDYLGLAVDNEIRRQFHSIANYSSSSSRLQTGSSKSHIELEDRAGLWYSRHALYVNSGWHANTGLIPAIADRDSVIIADKYVHASMIDGIRLSGAHFKRFRHQDLDQLERMLVEFSVEKPRVIVLVESIYSMDGDITNLRKLVDIIKRFDNVSLVVDEAHSIGLYGEKGQGLVYELGLLDDVDIVVAPLGKAFASMGAFIFSSRHVKDLLITSMRSFIFSTALPPIQAEWTTHMLHKVSLAHDERKRLHELSNLMVQGLTDITGEDNPSQSHIIPVFIRENDRSVRLSKRLQKDGFLVMAIRPPTVPRGTQRLRLTVRANMPKADLETFLEYFKDLYHDPSWQ